MTEKQPSTFLTKLNRKKPSKVWSVLDLLAIAWVILSLVIDFKKHGWGWVVADVLLLAMWIWCLRKDWAWYPKEDKSDEDQGTLNKTEELKDAWKDKSL